MLSGIHRQAEFDVIYDGITRHLEAAAQRSRGGPGRLYSSSSPDKLDLFSEEVLILLWHLFTLNPNFLRYVCHRRGAASILLPLVSLLLDASHYVHHDLPSSSSSHLQQNHSGGEGRKDEEELKSLTKMNEKESSHNLHEKDVKKCDLSQSSSASAASSALSRVGLLHMCSFILLVLSSERDFSVSLNDPFHGTAPRDLPVFQGTYADLLCLSIHRVIIDAIGPRGSSDSLVDMLLTVLCNISAYIKSFCLESCTRLLGLMDRLSRKAWLFSSPQHYHDIFFLLDVFNNLIQYQFEGNSQFIYSVLRQKKIFVDLENLSLPSSSSSSAKAPQRALLSGQDHSSLQTRQEHRNGKNRSPSSLQQDKKLADTSSSRGGAGVHTPGKQKRGGGNEEEGAMKMKRSDREDQIHKNHVRGQKEEEEEEELHSRVNDMKERKKGEEERKRKKKNKVAKRDQTDEETSSSQSDETDNEEEEEEEEEERREEEEEGEEEEEDWEPTQEWLHEWKSKLPLHTILRLIHCLLPQVEEECGKREVASPSDILDFLSKVTMVGLLPVPHPIIIRNYQPNVYTSLWYTSFTWGILLSSSSNAFRHLNWSKIRLLVMNS
ncbi:high-temperature-induced dauer-formation [Cystoisospora suis]|uniref:High-temperature-induced dauer-formation n=1 Tax=Cystoisospora suis TaxID=483139 RepID=A0A2C6KJU4_9APIC|nr:high-temperature-induced dauer-formation [Cystoisospora suis]